MNEHATTRSSDALGWGAVALVGVSGVAVFSQRVLEIGPQNCALRALAGIPCPLCGMSTVGLKLLRGDVAAAVSSDPLGAVVLLIVGLVAVVQLGRAVGVRLPLPPARPTLLAIGVALAGHWVTTLSGLVDLPPVA